MKAKMILACCDLGVDVDGSDKGPIAISNEINKASIIDKVVLVKDNIKKSKNELDLKKNLNGVNNFNTKLFNEVKKTINENLFPITIGGDHSIAIASALASIDKYDNLGVIWVDAHLDYNTFDTTITGNLHGLPLAAIDGLCKDLTKFCNEKYCNPKNTVVVGYRSEEINKEIEINNMKNSGATFFTTKDIEEKGIEYVMNEAIKIASNGTNGIHVSYDLDVIDPKIAPGVSVPEYNGINKKTALKIADILKENLSKIKSLDLVEYNPLFDKEKRTLELALKIINKIIK